MKLSDIGTAVENLPGVGKSTAALLSKLNIFTVSDLLSFYPRAYEDRTNKIPLSEYKTQKVHTICKVLEHQWFGYGKMRTLKIAITDGKLTAYLIAFNRPFLEKSLPVGSIIAVTGKFEVKYNSLQSTSFETERLSFNGSLSEWENATIPNSTIFSIYPLTEGLSQKILRKIIFTALKQYATHLDSEIPEEFIKNRSLLTKTQAIRLIHFPQKMQDITEARNTLIYEELFLFEQKMALRAFNHRGAFVLPENETSPKSALSEGEIKIQFEEHLSPRQNQLYKRLNFPLTLDQMRVILEMDFDIDKSQTQCNEFLNTDKKWEIPPFSMQRLLQGDVGSGKTLTAFFICLRTIDYGGQCAFLAPTELLARQHADNAAKLLEPLGVTVAFLTGNIKASGREKLLNALRDGKIAIVVGTHALFSRNVQYKNLSLAVIDEQHRFGVYQREAIIAKGRISKGEISHSPDVLMMSATPIPQTLALTAFGDLDISSIHTMPQGRKSIKTYLTDMNHQSDAYNAVKKELEAGHQAYFVYPRIGSDFTENDMSNGNAAAFFSTPDGPDGNNSLKNAEDMCAFLETQVYPQYKTALIHSKIPEEEQNAILSDFRDGKIQVLVATTVVEVGVDVPNATCIVIEHADRFGLAELHQLRGRVGRGTAQSYCILIYSKNITEEGIQRMKILRQNTDGFKIAEEDLKLRGPGQIAGTVQAGYLTLGIADLVRDKEMLLKARTDAFYYLQSEKTKPHTLQDAQV